MKNPILAFVFLSAFFPPAYASTEFRRSSSAITTKTSVYDTLPESKAQFFGVRFMKPVLPGVLYRGAGSGGQHPLIAEQLNALCEAGFSEAFYLYPNGFNSNQPITCRSNGRNQQLAYSVEGFRPRNGRHQTLKKIYDVIQNPGLGPVFVHCWNGWHASGEVAAIALMQFCGWSGSQAAAYWEKNIGDKGNISRYQGIMHKHIAGFEPFADLRIDESTQRKLCPQQ